MMDAEDQDRTSATLVKMTSTVPAPAPAATATSKDALAMKLKLSSKELKHLQDMITTEVGMEHLLQTAEKEGINMPALPSLPCPPDPFGEVAALQPEFPIEGLVLMAGNTTVDSGDKEDGVVNRVPPV